jgi:hypothetical protein
MTTRVADHDTTTGEFQCLSGTGPSGNELDHTEEFAMRLPRLATALAVGVMLCPGVSSAHELTPTECREARDFIRNAALSRDNGLSREQFMSRFDDDIALIRFYPPDLRWFVQDDDDERLLRSAAEQVFDAPEEPEQHGTAFLDACDRVVASYGAK